MALVDACASGSILDLPFTYSIESSTGRPKHREAVEVVDHYLACAKKSISIMQGRFKGIELIQRRLQEADERVQSFSEYMHSESAKPMLDMLDDLVTRKNKWIAENLELVKIQEKMKETEADVVSTLDIFLRMLYITLP